MKLVDSSGPKLPPIGSGPRGEVHLPPSMDSLSCVSCLCDHEKNRGEEAGEISSAVEGPARNFVPLMPDPKGFFDNPRQQEAVLAKPKRKSKASLADEETLIVKKKGKKEAPECEEEGERCNGVSTELSLLYDPYKIKKKLSKSDLGLLSRLLIPKLGVESHVLPWMSKELVERVKSTEGAEVVVWDADMRSEHRLVFAYWETSQSYVLKGGWNKEFVQPRGLSKGDQIGIYWDPIASRFLISLLGKAN